VYFNICDKQETPGKMDVDSLIPGVAQPSLFDLGSTSIGTLELFPGVWAAAEALAHPSVEVRQAGLQRLAEDGAARLSPLVVYLLATRLTDPDLSVRARVAQILGDVLAPDALGNSAPAEVRTTLKEYLSHMRVRQIFALLQVSVVHPEFEHQIARLLNICSYAGAHLTELLGSRKAPLEVRKQAARYIGLVGYLDALPFLERIVTRLEGRLKGQQAMPFVPPAAIDELDLLPEAQTALSMLQAP
jgi:hypothetical protein